VNALTVVIPTFNRQALLQRALDDYLAQTAAHSIRELIVVDDGSTDDTAITVSRVAARSPFEIRYFRQQKKGPAAARNLGIREAKSELILFTDDDILPTPTLVAEHLAWHSTNPEPQVVVLGHVTWAPEVNATPFMIWYGSDGALFGYEHLQSGIKPNYTYFYSCNLSLKTQFLRSTGTFDEEFTAAAFEDIELGYRLQRSGMRLLYNPGALAYHHQFVSFADACQRGKKTAMAREVFVKKDAGRDSTALVPLRQRIEMKAVKCLAPLGIPFKPLMDIRFPLPRTVYRFMFHAFCD
jgi:glycosyltransferase involved in cell wall biosynthesis